MPTIRYTLSGITQDGQKFRPSDWTERLVCIQKEQLIKYNGHLKISKIDDIKSIVFDNSLENTCPITYERIMSFAKTNHLVMNQETIED